ncbi:MAG: glycogen/starch synthase [Dysgonamonadaceae bacterium]|jgi:glycosyltransferase involved in cell wall biosynthesis|nr:glycogen/starch synthase [Dysgonamonadaceae bacterium]
MAEIAYTLPDFIFESSWEVCNKVGGIYTVLSTRAKTLQDIFGDKLIFIGPDLWNGITNPDFIESKTLLKDWKKYALEKENLKVRIGRWNVPGKPIVILVDFLSYYEVKNSLYFRMWEQFGVDSIAAYGDYDESNLFAYSVGLVIESLYKYRKLDKQKIIAHFNEWMLGMALLYLQDCVPEIATVFTTHATSIGRSICGNNKPLYEYLTAYNGDWMAKELNMEAKHSLEKQTACYADCFTTVSELTAEECQQLLDKRPDVVTPNGFESNFVPQGELYDKKRKIAREKLLEVTTQLTGELVSEDAFLLAISGRYEYKNKGIDIFVEAMNRVRLANPERQIIAFILVPAWANGPRTDLQSRLKKPDIRKFPLYNPYYTHNLNFPEQDKVCEYLRYLDFVNHEGVKTKIIFVPSYLNGTDGIFNLSYYDLLPGLDMTVFPSYYEPWGYTPLESIAFGVPTITTNLAGFGLWAKMEGASEQDITTGVKIVIRNDENYLEAAEILKESIISYATTRHPALVAKVRNAATVLSKKAAWSHFISYYLEAYDIALRNAGKRKN